jgi:hypothetical protein
MLRKSARYALRSVVLIAVVVALTMVHAPASVGDSPYLSALSAVAAWPAFAAGCPNKACDRGVSCYASAGFKCIHFNGKGCTATVCS